MNGLSQEGASWKGTGAISGVFSQAEAPGLSISRIPTNHESPIVLVRARLLTPTFLVMRRCGFSPSCIRHRAPENYHQMFKAEHQRVKLA